MLPGRNWWFSLTISCLGCSLLPPPTRKTMKPRRHFVSLPFSKTLSLAVLAAMPAVATAVTWTGGGDANWATPANWGGTAPVAIGSTLVFDTGNNLTNVNNIVTSAAGITYNSGAGAFVSTSSVGVLTLTGNVTDNSTNIQTLDMSVAMNTTGTRAVTVVSGGKLTLGSTGAAYTHSVNNGTTNFTGAGEVEILANSTGSFTVGTAPLSSIVDMSGLSKLTANVGKFKLGADSINYTTGTAATVTLAASNYITTANMEIGRAIGSGGVQADGVLKLGTSNTIRVDNLYLGEKRSDGTIRFSNTGNGSSVTIGGNAGAKTTVSMGYYQTSPGAYSPTGIADFTGGTVNATLADMTLGRQAPGGAVTTTNNTASGTWTMEAGTVTADTVRLGYWSTVNTLGTNVGNQIAQGFLNINGGSFTVGVGLRVGDGVVGSVNTHARGTVAISSGTLEVSGLFLLGNSEGGGTAANQRGTLSITGGTVNANVGITTNNAQSTLTLNGGTLDMKGNKIGTAAQPIGGNSGALNWTSGTLKNLLELNGGAVLNKSTVGTLILAGTNFYTGGTTISAGTIQIGAGSSLGSVNGTLTVNTGGTLDINGNDLGVGNFTGSGGNIVNNASGTNKILTIGNNNGTGGNFAGVIADNTSGTGTVALLKTGNGTLTLSGSVANTYTGLTKVSVGELDLAKSPNTNAVGGNVTVDGGTLKWLAGEQMGNGAALNLSNGGAVNLNGNTETLGTFTNSGGTFSTGAGTLIGTGATVTWSGGTNTINDGGVVQDSHIVISGGINTVEGGASGGTLRLEAGGAGLEMSGGSTLTLNSDNAVPGKLSLKGGVSSSGDSMVTIASGLSNTNKGVIDLNGGVRTLTVGNGASVVDMLISAPIANGGLTKLGGGTLQLTGTNTYTGQTTVSAGVMLVDGSIAGAVSVDSLSISEFGTLGGNGTIAGTLDVSNYGVLAPGSSIGTLASGALTFNNGAVFAYEMNAGTAAADLIKVTGDLTIFGDVNLDLANLSPVAFAPNTTISLISYTGAWNHHYFIFEGNVLEDNEGFTDGYNNWRIVYGAPSGGLNVGEGESGKFVNLTNTQLTAVPEPGSLLALGCLVGAGTFLRSRRRK